MFLQERKYIILLYRMEVSLLSCPVCLKPHFQGVDALRSSLISVATTHISCPVCTELFLGLDKLTIHLFSHITNTVGEETGSQANKVEVGNIVTESCLDKVIFNAVQDIDMIDKTEIDLPSIEEKILQTETTKNRVICDICNFYFSDETILDLHQKLLHQTSPDRKTGKYSYHCHLCSKQFRMRGSLMVHLRVAHFGFIQNNRNTSKAMCIDTNADQQDPESNKIDQIAEDALHKKQQSIAEQKKLFVMPVQLPSTQLEKRKMINGTSKAQDNKQWECEVCLKLFTTKYFLKKHKRLHTGEMPYFCSQCNKYFTFQQSYHKHMLYHSDDKPHICSECGRAFKELSTLHNHERIHSGERPFSCETCGKRFRQRVSYLVHRRIHTGAMPYKCTACNKSFRYKVSQRSHKCPVSPPGCVIRTPDLVEKLIQNQKVSDEIDSNQSSPEAHNLLQIFNIGKEDLNTVNHKADPNVKNVISIDNAIESFDFLEQNLQVDVHNNSDINMSQNYLPTNVMLDKKQIELDKNAQPAVENSVVKGSSETSNLVDQENIQEFTNFTSNNAENAKGSAINTFISNESGNPDFFALILSPVLSDVQSLCLSNYTNTQNNTKKENVSTNGNEDVLQTINEESFKELLYGSTSN